MLDLTVAPAQVNKNVEVQTRIQSDGKPDHQIAKGTPAIQELRVRNKRAGTNLFFKVESTSLDAGVVYGDTNSPTWPTQIPAGGPRSAGRRAEWKQRATNVDHPGKCATGNAHTIQVAVEVTTANPDERLHESEDLFYDVTCKC